MKWPPSLSPQRRQMLERLRDSAEPLSLAQILCGKKNQMPTLLRAGWVKSRYARGEQVEYEITDAGRSALASA